MATIQWVNGDEEELGPELPSLKLVQKIVGEPVAVLEMANGQVLLMNQETWNILHRQDGENMGWPVNHWAKRILRSGERIFQSWMGTEDEILGDLVLLEEGEFKRWRIGHGSSVGTWQGEKSND